MLLAAINSSMCSIALRTNLSLRRSGCSAIHTSSDNVECSADSRSRIGVCDKARQASHADTGTCGLVLIAQIGHFTDHPARSDHAIQPASMREVCLSLGIGDELP
jgi:hypothetical protein